MFFLFYKGIKLVNENENNYQITIDRRNCHALYLSSKENDNHYQLRDVRR